MYFLTILLSLSAQAEPFDPNMSVSTKREIRCDVDWQMFPGFLDPTTHGNFRRGGIVLEEFEKPILVHGSMVYGLGGESGNASAKDVEIGGDIILLNREDKNSVLKLTYGVLTQEHPLSNVTTDVSKAILSFGSKIPKIGFLIVDRNNPDKAAFQRAPIDSDPNQASFLKPLSARCKISLTNRKVHPFQYK